MKYDIVLISTPVMETRFPAPAIYYLKGALKPYGFSARCFDLVRDQEDYFRDKSNKINSFVSTINLPLTFRQYPTISRY